MFLIYFFVFFLGAIFGSFLNVVALRWNTGFGIHGRSMCVACSKPLHWYELIPVVSFLVQRGKCRGCKTRLSPQYLLVELLTGVVFLSLFLKFVTLNLELASLVLFGISLLLFSLYTVILIYDVRHTIIPDPLVFTAIVVAFIARLIMGGTLLDWLAGPLVFTFFGLIWLLSRGRAMGFGDAKLGLSLGLFLGAANGFSGVILAFWIGTVLTLGIMAFTKFGFPLLRKKNRLTMKSEVPFAPFLILGAWLALLFNLDLFNVLLFHKSKGFTLVELMVSVAIMVTITALVMMNQNKYTEDVALNQIADDVGLTLRQAQIYGVSVREFSPGTTDFSASYGVEFDITSRGSRSEYISFGDRGAKNGIYDGAWSCPTGGASECISKITMRAGNDIESICLIHLSGADNCNIGRVAITFNRPETDAGILFFNSGGTYMPISNIKGARINLRSATGTRSIVVYTTGQVSIQ